MCIPWSRKDMCVQNTDHFVCAALGKPFKSPYNMSNPVLPSVPYRFYYASLFIHGAEYLFICRFIHPANLSPFFSTPTFQRCLNDLSLLFSWSMSHIHTELPATQVF